MIEGIVSFLVAFLGLGFLILIHELGHFLVARKVGMKVEAFGIGFGKPIYSFKYHGVPINICPIPFGGYVKIAGMESDKKNKNEAPKDGFFSKSPFARMAVAVSGPLFNLAFAIFAFSLIWALGGREKSYNEVSARIGYLEPASELYKNGVRSGDRILKYNGKPVTSSKDHLYAAMTSGPQLQIEYEKAMTDTNVSTPEQVVVTPYQDPRAFEKGILTNGIMAPASYIIWNPPKDPAQKAMFDTCSASGIEIGDRIVWAEGERVFSSAQLNSIVNNNRVYLTVLRNGSYVHVSIPRIQLSELMLPKDVYGELSDWRYESPLESTPFHQLWFIPYNISLDCKVEAPLSSLESSSLKSHESTEFSESLVQGDQIVAISGEKVQNAIELLKALQQKKALIIVDRSPQVNSLRSFQEADNEFMRPFRSKELANLIALLGTPDEQKNADSLVVLNPIVLRNQAALEKLLGNPKNEAVKKEEEAKLLNSVEDPSIRPEIERQIQLRDKELYLGLVGVHDRQVLFNPNPIAMCRAVGEEIYQTGSALIGGYMSPRWMSGPVGIVQVIQQQMRVGWMEVMFWLGAISLNLAVLNLFPLPVLDGGYVLLSVFELCTGFRVRAQTVEKIVLPFALAFIAFILYLTYHDIMRLCAQLIRKWGLF